MMMDVNGLGFGYGSLEILREVGFSLDRSEVLTILGPNGVGKTTLLKCLNGILRTRTGTVLVGEEDLLSMSRSDVAKKVGYVAQRGEVSRITVFDSVLLGRKPYIRWDITKKDVEMANAVIDKLGLGHLALRYVNEISGGEYQKVQIARALVQEPRVLLLDEPTSNLDLSNQHRIMCAVSEIVKRNGLCAVLTMHDLNLSLRFSDRFIMMKGGKVFASGGHEVITPENIEAVYDIPVIVENVKGRPMVVPA